MKLREMLKKLEDVNPNSDVVIIAPVGGLQPGAEIEVSDLAFQFILGGLDLAIDQGEHGERLAALVSRVGIEGKP